MNTGKWYKGITSVLQTENERSLALLLQLQTVVGSIPIGSNYGGCGVMVSISVCETLGLSSNLSDHPRPQ